MTNLTREGRSDEMQLDNRKGLSWMECFLQIFYFIQGPVFFTIPGVFKNVGYLPGIAGFFGIGLLNLHFLQLYLWSEKEVRRRNKSITAVTLDSLVEHVFSGLVGKPRLALYLKTYLKYEIIIGWFLGFAYAEIIICQNFALTLNYYGFTASSRLILLYICVPLSAMSMVPNLKSMTHVAHLSTLVIVVIILETLFYVFTNQTPLPEVNLIGDISTLPTYFNTVIFSLGFSPMLFPFKNEMKHPDNFGSITGSLSTATFLLIVLNCSFSFLCYLRFGVNTQENIVRNLPGNALVAITSAAATVTMICGGALAFYAIFQMLWCGTLDTLFQNCTHIKLYEYATRIIVFSCITAVALFVPSLSILINFASCFSWPYDVIFIPIAMETVIELKFNTFRWKKIVIVLKNAILTVFCVAYAVVSLLLSISELSDYANS